MAAGLPCATTPDLASQVRSDGLLGRPSPFQWGPPRARRFNVEGLPRLANRNDRRHVPPASAHTAAHLRAASPRSAGKLAEHAAPGAGPSWIRVLLGGSLCRPAARAAAVPLER